MKSAWEFTSVLRTDWAVATVHDYKASRWDFDLKNYEGVLEWINAYAPNPDGRLYVRNNRLVVVSEDGVSGG